MKRNFLDYLWLFFKGMAMGAADIVPGVSGGTIAFISGIYEELISTLCHEMVHVKQYIRGQLDQDSDLDYFDRPSEIEAYQLQEELLELWKSK